MITTILFWILKLFLVVASLFLAGYLHFYFIGQHYWSKRKIPHLKPRFLVGNTKEANVSKSLTQILDDIYKENKDKRFIGFWVYVRPVLLIRDLSLIKNILVKDFPHFRDRGFHVNEEKEPINGNLFTLEGAKWRHMRVKLTPTFTSGKMKMMFPTMLDCGKELAAFLKKPAELEEIVEMKEALSCFTTDTISSCAFGLEINSFKHPDSEFRRQGKKVFKPGASTLIQMFLAFCFPGLDKWISFRRFDKDMCEFFKKTVRETIEYRERNGIKRKDFMDLMVELKNKGYVEDPDADQANKEESGSKFTVEQAAAQAVVFFAAGFETASTCMTFAVYELARNPDKLKLLQNELDSVIAKHGGQITYEGIQEMEYLDQVINESLRLYPPAGLFFRECTKDYPIPDTDIVLKKGTIVWIPAGSLGRDPEYFSNPDSFQPERFSPEEKAKRDPFCHLPFGEGPRICIASRFGLMQAKIGLISVLYNYDVHVCKETPIPLKVDPQVVAPSPINGMRVRITKRK